MVRFSFIVPVYNRRDEVRDLLESLVGQTCRDFEAIIVEDGSTERCESECDVARTAGLDVRYYYKENEGRSIARNYGIANARGEYFIFVDSDCIIPPEYVANIAAALDKTRYDCYGGPDAAHESFSDTQKAINFAMTSFLTTGGIRGGRHSLERFTPRTFNMGFSRTVYNRVGGFREMFSEDIDMSKRISGAGFTTGLIVEAPVWHKRRVNFRKFFRQVYVFGMSRITLKLLYPESMKIVHTLPAVALFFATIMVLMAVLSSPWWLLPIGIYAMALFITALVKTRSMKVGLLAVPASAIQIIGYGSGFIRAWVTKIVFGRGRDVEQEIKLRKGR